MFKFCLRITLILCYWYSPFHLIPPSPLLTAFLLSSPLLTFEMQVKGGGWDSETGCIPFQYVCRTYAVAGENYDWMYEVYSHFQFILLLSHLPISFLPLHHTLLICFKEHDNGDVFLFKLAASTEDFSITIVDVIFLVSLPFPAFTLPSLSLAPFPLTSHLLSPLPFSPLPLTQTRR